MLRNTLYYLVGLLFVLSFTSSSFAGSTTVLVEGRGDTLDGALFDAFNKAVSQTGQAAVINRLELSSGDVIKDYQSFVTSGFIESYEIEQRSFADQQNIVLVRCTVMNSIDYPETTDLFIPNTDLDVLRANKVLAEKKGAHLEKLVGPLSDWFKSAYSLEYLSFQVTSSTGYEVTGHHLFQLKINPVVFSQLRNTIKAIGSTSSVEPGIYPYGFFNIGEHSKLGFSHQGVAPALLSNLPGLMTSKISIGGVDLSLTFFLDWVVYSTLDTSKFSVAKDIFFLGDLTFHYEGGPYYTDATNLRLTCPITHEDGDYRFSSGFQTRPVCASNPLSSKAIFIKIPFHENLETFDDSPTFSFDLVNADYANTLYLPHRFE